jgi:RNA polymerase sigma-70 factor, ECF subfamily
VGHPKRRKAKKQIPRPSFVFKGPSFETASDTNPYSIVPVTPSDVELVQQALAGSQVAYRDLVTRYATPAVNLAARMVRDRAVAEDLAQEAFARAFERLSTYDQQRRFVSWFFQILHNVTIDYLRRRRPIMVSLDELEGVGHPAFDTSSAEGSPDVKAEQAELARAVEAALALIRPEYREVVVLRYREDLSVQEIAQIMGVAAGTVKTHLYRARKELGTILSAQGWITTPSGTG